jgi:hypothetical protein
LFTCRSNQLPHIEVESDREGIALPNGSRGIRESRRSKHIEKPNHCFGGMRDCCRSLLTVFLIDFYRQIHTVSLETLSLYRLWVRSVTNSISSNEWTEHVWTFKRMRYYWMEQSDRHQTPAMSHRLSMIKITSNTKKKNYPKPSDHSVKASETSQQDLVRIIDVSRNPYYLELTSM